jgi:N-acetylneuraminate lyase
MDRITGILPALLTPMDAEGKINFDELGRLITWLYDQGVHGLYVGGTSGEGLLLTTAERKAVIDKVVEKSRGRGKVMVHVGSVSTAESVELAQYSERAGADAIASVPPFAYGKSLAGIHSHYYAISKSCKLPFYLYNIPSLTSVSLKAEDVARLTDLPTVKGLKFSDDALFEEFRIISLKPKLDVFHGCDETLLYALMAGAVGGVGLIYNLMPKKFVELFTLAKEGKLVEANKLQLSLSAFIDQFLSHAEGNPVGLTKAVMEGHGFHCGPARSPNPPISNESVTAATKLASAFWSK